MSWPLVDPQKIKDGMAAAKARGVKLGRPRSAICKRGHVRTKNGACRECELNRQAERYARLRNEVLAKTRRRQTEQRRAAGVAARREGLDPEKAAVTRNAQAALRRARVLRQTPPWVDLKRIKEIYRVARQMQRDLGVRMAVDHVVPLKGEVVSGLHVHENLRIMPYSENARKYNNYQCT